MGSAVRWELEQRMHGGRCSEAETSWAPLWAPPVAVFATPQMSPDLSSCCSWYLLSSYCYGGWGSVWARCFQALGILFKNEIKSHTGCKVARKLFKVKQEWRLEKKAPSRLTRGNKREHTQGPHYWLMLPFMELRRSGALGTSLFWFMGLYLLSEPCIFSCSIWIKHAHLIIQRHKMVDRDSF